MKGSEKNVYFPIKSSASPKGSDENNRSNREMGLNLQNPKKQQTEKNFMSPTVSAVSKASFPRKKILADRNESPGSNSFNTHLSKTPNLDSKPSPMTIPKASQKISPNLVPKLTSKEPSSQRTPSSYNSRDETPSPRPYDPLTNYLSPRPQFLRYDPSRRKEIFLRLEMEDKEGDDGLTVSSTASLDSKKADGDEVDTVSSDNSSSLQEDEEFGDGSGSLLEQEDEEFDIESDEEAEEETGWSLRRVLKYMFLLVVLVLTTSYISSMNSPSHAPAFQGLTLGYQRIQNRLHEIVQSVEVGYMLFDGKHARLGLLGLKQAIFDEGSIEEEMAQNVNVGEIVSLELEDRNVESVEMVEEVQKDGKNEDACERELFKGGEAPDKFAEDVELQEKETVEMTEEVEKAEDVEENEESDDIFEDELVKTGKVSDQLVKDIVQQEGEETGEQIEDVKENGESQDVIEDELVKTGEISDQLVEDIELQERKESGEEIEDLEKVEDISQDVVEEELVETGEVSDQMVGDIELLGQEITGKIFFQGDPKSLLSEGTAHQEAASHATDSSLKERVVPKEAGEEIHNETRDNDMVQGKIIRFGTAHQEATSYATDSSEKERVVPKEAGEEIHNETRDNDMVQGKIIRFGNSISMASVITMLERWCKSVTLNFEEVNPLKGLNQHMGNEILLTVMFGFLTCAAIVASLVLGIRRKGIASKDSYPVDKHSAKPVVMEKPSLVLPAEREEHETHVDSFLNTTPLISSMDKDIREIYQSRAPSVELLGEFEVGGASSSLRSCAIKRRMKDEVSSYSEYLEKGLGSKANSAPVQEQQDFSEFSTVNSNLSERLTAKKKLFGKEFGSNDMVCFFLNFHSTIFSIIISETVLLIMLDHILKLEPTNSAPVQEQQDFSEFSTVNSNLSERLIAKKKLFGKEFGSNDMAGAKGEEVRNNVVTTPLRRSARIRGRADVASP
ncbi:hypothetical protein REPUB_Repub14bG0056000 [Reevesia pubescens]